MLPSVEPKRVVMERAVIRFAPSSRPPVASRMAVQLTQKVKAFSPGVGDRS